MKRKIIALAGSVLAVGFLVMLPTSTALAQNASPSSTGCPTGTTSQNGFCIPDSPCPSGSICGQSTLPALILKVINYLLAFAGIIAVVFLIVGGFWYITAAGNEEQAEKGRKALLNAIIGLVIIIMAFAIVSIVNKTLTGTSALGGS